MYEFRQVTTDTESLSRCADLLRAVFPGSNNFTEDYVKWEYADNPAGNIVGFNAFEDDKLVAHYVTQPAIANVWGKQMKGLLSLNTATHPNHRGKKLFTTLANMTYKYAAEKGFKFVFGVANENSTPGFLYKLGFQYVGPLEVKLGIGRIRRDKVKNKFSFERLWTKELIEWRLKNPIRKYIITDNSIYAPTGKYGIKAILGRFDSLLLNSIPTFKNVSMNPIRLYMVIDSSIIWKKSKYYDVPKRLRPSPLNFIFKDLTGNNLKLDVSMIKFQTIDFDAY
jgi:N-acetylglutamate synthase-like GNAT family acetyltransferase